MTCREKLKIEHPCGESRGCPHEYGYLAKPGNCLNAGSISCEDCWDREIPDVVGLEKELQELREQEEKTYKENNELKVKIEKVQTLLRETRMKLEEKDRCLTDNTKALLSMVERLKKYEANGEHINKKASDYHMKFQALRDQGFTEDQAMQFLPMWMDD